MKKTKKLKFLVTTLRIFVTAVLCSVFYALMAYGVKSGIDLSYVFLGFVLTGLLLIVALMLVWGEK